MDANSKPPLSLEDIARLNQELLDDVAAAKAEYEFAKSEVTRLNELKRHLGAGHPDGAMAALNALRLQSVATRRYTDAIRALSEFTLDRKIPGKNP